MTRHEELERLEAERDIAYDLKLDAFRAEQQALSSKKAAHAQLFQAKCRALAAERLEHEAWLAMQEVLYFSAPELGIVASQSSSLYPRLGTRSRSVDVTVTTGLSDPVQTALEQRLMREEQSAAAKTYRQAREGAELSQKAYCYLWVAYEQATEAHTQALSDYRLARDEFEELAWQTHCLRKTLNAEARGSLDATQTEAMSD